MAPGAAVKGTKVKRGLLRSWPVPVPDDAADKTQRGTVLIVGGSIDVPGAIVLAGVAALRAGAGRLRLATSADALAALGVAMPEASVTALSSSTGGVLGKSAGVRASKLSRDASVALVGPGMVDRKATARFLDAFLKPSRTTPLVIDARAAAGLDHRHRPLVAAAPAVLTPHAGELASMMDTQREDVASDPPRHALEAAAAFGAVVVLKGSDTWIAAPDGDLFRYTGGRVGLATSGSGDVLAGIVAGLLARGADAVQAAVWAVFLHGEAGNVLAKRIGPLGFLARELPAEVPRLMHALI
jgi:ADP-dependent NAD(P)H-hydrate dehydratase